jgi:hypothetical protein
MSRWNREAALLGIPDLPEEAFKHVGDGKIKPQGGGGGGQTTSTNYTSNVPEYAQAPFMEMIGKGFALSEAPYQAYGGERVAQFSPLQQQAFQQAGQQQVAGQVGLGSGLAAMSGLSSFTQPGTAGQFMSPFIMGALAPQLQELSRQSAIQGTQQQAEAVGRGAFGGSRDALMRGLREENLLRQQSDVLGRGLQAAFESGQGQFNQEQANRLQAASALGQLGQTQFGQQMDITNLQSQMGTTQQNQIQKILDQQYADFQQQRDFPYQQLGFMSDLLRGTGGSSRSIYSTPQQSGLQTLAGLGTLGFGLGRMADGGEVKRYAVGGGVTGLLTDGQLAQRAQQAPTTMGRMAAQNEMDQRAELLATAPRFPMDIREEEPELTEEQVLEILAEALRTGDERAAAAAQEVLAHLRARNEEGITSVAPESVGDIPDGGIAMMASGGPVSFQAGELVVRTPYTARKTSGQRMLDDAMQAGADAQEWLLTESPPIVGSQAVLGGLGSLAEAVADTKALPYSPGYMAQRERDEAARAARRVKPKSSESPLAAAAPMPESMAAAIPPGARVDDRRRLTNPGYRPAVPQVAAPADVAQTPPAGTAPPAAPAARGPSGIAQFAELYRQAGYDPEAQATAEAEALRALDAARQAAADQNLADLEAEQKQRGVYDEEGEKRAKADIESLEGKKKEAKKMAIIQAGLAILSADPSRGAWSAIGTGALKGVGEYKGDLAEIEAKREKINSRLDRIAEIRRQESVADGKEKLALRRERNGLEAEAKKEVAEFTKNQGVRTGQYAGDLVKLEVDRRKEELDRNERRVARDAAIRGQSGDLAEQRLASQILNNRRLTIQAQLAQAKADFDEDAIRMLTQELNNVDLQLSRIPSLAKYTGSTPPAGGKVGASATLPPGFKLD